LATLLPTSLRFLPVCVNSWLLWDLAPVTRSGRRDELGMPGLHLRSESGSPHSKSPRRRRRKTRCTRSYPFPPLYALLPSSSFLRGLHRVEADLTSPANHAIHLPRLPLPQAQPTVTSGSKFRRERGRDRHHPRARQDLRSTSSAITRWRQARRARWGRGAIWVLGD
ncbi:hypothetical protein B0H14DRAFT_3637477, partial [Mycena olivaceomarginata]